MKTNPRFSNGALQERSQNSSNAGTYACFSCMRMLPAEKFKASAISGPWRRDGTLMQGRFCIECINKLANIEKSRTSIAAQEYACFSCMTMLPAGSFEPRTIRGKRGFLTKRSCRECTGDISELNDQLVQLESSPESETARTYACFSCLQMLNEWKFADTAITETKARIVHHAQSTTLQNQKSRYCIQCGIEGPSNTAGFAKGTPFYIGKERFVKCGRCNKLGKASLSRGNRRVACETCEMGMTPRSSEEVLNEVWNVARRLGSKGRFGRQDRESWRQVTTGLRARLAYIRGLVQGLAAQLRQLILLSFSFPFLLFFFIFFVSLVLGLWN